MVTITKILNWTRVIPYVCSVIFFLLLTFPGIEKFNYHAESGYWSYAIIGSCLVLLAHAGFVHLFFKFLINKNPNEEVLITLMKERFNFLIGLGVVILYEGVVSSYFPYRQWAYGVTRAETVIEKINDEWNLKQIEKSKETSVKMNKSVIDYTESIYSKWKILKSK